MIERAALERQARGWHLRHHKQARDRARLAAREDARLTDMDARLTRCPVCQEWTYRSTDRALPGSTAAHRCVAQHTFTDDCPRCRPGGNHRGCPAWMR